VSLGSSSCATRQCIQIWVLPRLSCTCTNPKPQINNSSMRFSIILRFKHHIGFMLIQFRIISIKHIIIINKYHILFIPNPIMNPNPQLDHNPHQFHIKQLYGLNHINSPCNCTHIVNLSLIGIKRTTQNNELVIQLASPGGKNIATRWFILKTQKIGFRNICRLVGLQDHQVVSGKISRNVHSYEI